jgi:hypothetical protein
MIPADALLRGLGHVVDLVQHCHPLGLDRPDPPDRSQVFCYPIPLELPPATGGTAGSIARACFVGSVNYVNASRLVWWAESAGSATPLDFFENDVGDGQGRPVEQYAQLLRDYQIVVNYTRRAGGPKILTGRAIEAALAGSMLLEENSVDTAYFFTPGVHYLPFETWADLAELVPWLLGNPEYRQRLARAAHAWATRYFTGDWYWAGLLDRLL